MSGETEEKTSGWTVDTLMVHMLQLFAEREERYDQRFTAQEKATITALTAAKEAVSSALTATKEAVGKAETSAEKRFDSVNEFRAQLSDQAATFMPRAEADLAAKAVSEKIADMSSRLDRKEGDSGGKTSLFAQALAGLSLAVAIATVIVVALK